MNTQPKKNTKGGLIVLAVIVLAAGIFAATTSHSPTRAPVASGPMYNMRTLGASIMRTVNKSRTGTSTIVKVACIRTGAQTAECNGTDRSGYSDSVTTYITKDGAGWETAGN